MSTLIAGIVLWSLVHFVPAGARGFRDAVTARIGINPYKGIFSLLIVGSVLLMVLGWKAAGVIAVYAPPEWGAYAAIVLMFAASVLFFAARIRSSLSRFMRHPQLTGVFVFGIAHLLANGEGRSLVLFGGLALWAVLEVLLINRRDGAWVRPPADAPTHNLRLLLVGTVFFVVFALLHRWLFGVAPLAYLQAG